MTHVPAYPHDPIEEVLPDLFFVRGSFPVNALVRISRNMVIVRYDEELTLVNPIRLEAKEEGRLRELGEVRRLLRLGPLHGADDPYYVDEYEAELWAPGRSRTHPRPEPDVIFDERTRLPLPGAELLCLRGLREPEAVLCLHRDGGVLVPCDSIQSYGDMRHCNLAARLVMPLLGFRRDTLVGPLWLKRMAPEEGSLESELRRVLGLDFEHLLPAHGSPVWGGAHTAVAVAIDRAFSR